MRWQAGDFASETELAIQATSHLRETKNYVERSISATEQVDDGLVLPEPPTRGEYKNAEAIEHSEYYDCPMCEGEGTVEGSQYINFDNKPLNVLFSGIGDEYKQWEKWFSDVLAAIAKTGDGK